MAIKTITGITINSQNTAYGGFVYSFDYNIEFGDRPSTAIITLINESGTYSINENSIRTNGAPDIIRISNNKTLRMYPVRYKKVNSGSGKLLEVEYHDTSIRFLDKITVLSNIINANKNNPPPNTLVLGEEYFREDDGFGVRRLYNANQLQEQGGQRSLINFGEILYTLEELRDAMINRGVPLDQSAINALKDKSGYAVDYTGKLRDVLAAIGDDIGFTFYWSEESRLSAIDLRNPIKVNPPNFNNYLISSSEEKNLIGTFANNSSSFYLEQGYIEPSDNSIKNRMVFKELEFPVSAFGLSEFQDNTVKQERDAMLKAAYYGQDFYFATLLYLLSRQNKTASTQYILSQAFQADNTPVGINSSSLEHKALSSYLLLPEDDYNFFYITDTEKSITLFKKLQSLAFSFGRFYISRCNFRTANRYSYEKDFIWYPENIQVGQTILGEYFNKVEGIPLTASLGSAIKELGYILDFQDPTEEPPRLNLGKVDPEQRGVGYAIMENSPLWQTTDNFSDDNFSIGQLIEGSAIGESLDLAGFDLSQNNIILAVKKGNSVINGINSISFPTLPSSIDNIGFFDQQGFFTVPRNNSFLNTNVPSGSAYDIIYNIREIDSESLALFASKEGIGGFIDNEVQKNPNESEESFLARLENLRRQGEQSANSQSNQIETRIQQLHQILNTQQVFSKTNAFTEKVFEASGVLPVSAFLTQGLRSISVRYGDQGVFTSYTFADNEIKIPSENIIRQKLERQTKVGVIIITKT